MLATLTGCSMKSFVTPAAVVSGAAVGSIAGPGGAALGAGVAYAGAELWTITTGDVQGIVAAQIRGQEGKINEVTSGIWKTLKYAAFVVLGIMSIPLFITRSNSKKLDKICEETKHAKTD